MTAPSTELTFAEFLVSRKRALPFNGWGDFARVTLSLGAMPVFGTWAQLRSFVEHHQGFDIRTTDAKSAWQAYQVSLVKFRRERAAEPASLPT